MSERNWLRNTPALVGAIIGALFLGMAWTNHALFYHSEQRPKTQEGDSQPTQHEGNEPAPKAQVVRVETAANPDTKRNPERTENEQQANSNENALLGDRLAQGLMAILAVPGLLISGWAVWLVRGSLNESRKATKATEDSAKAALIAADVAQSSLILTARAFIGAPRHNMRLNWDKDGSLSGIIIQLEWKNTGATGAQNVRSGGLYHEGVEGAVPPFDGEIGFRSDIGREASTRSDVILLSIERAAEIWTGQRRLFIYSRINYDDVFRGQFATPRRFTEAYVECLFHRDPREVPRDLNDTTQIARFRMCSSRNSCT